MSNKNNKHDLSVPGSWYTTKKDDDSGTGCIACAFCFSNSPSIYESDEEGYAYVKKQPETQEELDEAETGKLGCPAESISNDNE